MPVPLSDAIVMGTERISRGTACRLALGRTPLSGALYLAHIDARKAADVAGASERVRRICGTRSAALANQDS